MGSFIYLIWFILLAKHSIQLNDDDRDEMMMMTIAKILNCADCAVYYLHLGPTLQSDSMAAAVSATTTTTAS